MARVKLPLPSQFAYSTEIAVRIDDINYGGHLGNDALLALLHEARVRFLADMGYSVCPNRFTRMIDNTHMFRRPLGHLYLMTTPANTGLQ